VNCSELCSYPSASTVTGAHQNEISHIITPILIICGVFVVVLFSIFLYCLWRRHQRKTAEFKKIELPGAIHLGHMDDIMDDSTARDNDGYTIYVENLDV
jgi:heme/copper-type cytochrome/quinol oxidase subunit 2